jgi:hypothetical protein
LPISPQQRNWLAAGLTLAVAATALLAGHTIFHAIRVRRSVEAVRPWMSVPYIARSHRLPPKLLFDAIGVQPNRFDFRPLGRIARQQRRPVDELIGRINTVIEQHKRATPGHGP